MTFLHHPIESLEHIIQHNPQYGLLATFLISFIESLAILGSIVPGTLTMGIIGSMVGAALLPLIPTVILAFVGAYTGDILSFVVGKRCHNWIRNLSWVQKHESWIQKAEDFIQKNGFSSIIIGRFFGPMRSMVPMIAGTLRMNNIKFLIAAIPSAALWVLVYLSPGIMIGMFSRDIELFSRRNIIIFSLIMLFACIVSYYYPRVSNTVRIRYQTWLQQFGEHQDTINYRAIACCLFSIFTIFVFLQSNLSSKYQLYYLLQSFHTEKLNYISTAVTLLADKVSFIGFVIILASCMQYKGMRHFIISVLISFTVAYAAKAIFHVHRPPKIDAWNSFPSGHSIRSSFLLIYMYLFLRPSGKHWLKIICAMVILVMISRLYLGAHWWPDVLAGSALGSSLAYFLHSFKFERKMRYNNTKVIFLALALMYSGVLYVKMIPYLKDFTSPMTNKNIELNKWLNEKSPVPIYLEDRFGKPCQPININWLSSEHYAKNILKNAGWRVSGWPKTWFERLAKTLENPEIKFLPALAKLYNGEVPVIIAYKINGNKLYYITLWKSNYIIKNTKLLIGSSKKYDILVQNNHNHFIKERPYVFKLPDKNMITKFGKLLRPPFKPIRREVNALEISKIYSRNVYANDRKRKQ